MGVKILILIISCFLGLSESSSFANFQKSVSQAAIDVSSINERSGDILKQSAGLVQEDPSQVDANCGGWFQKACPPTTTTTPAPTTPQPCGGWFQSKCEPQGLALEVTTTAQPTTPKACGGWLQPKCEAKALVAEVTTPAPTTAPTTSAPCGGWFQAKCETQAAVTTTAPPTTEPTTAQPCGGWLQPKCQARGLALEVTTVPPTPFTTASPCGGWFQPACPAQSLAQVVTTTTTPKPKKCGGFLGVLQSDCETPTTTPAPQTQSCGWLYCSDIATTAATTPKPRSWGLFGSYSEATIATTAAPKGWIATIFTGVVDKANLAVDTALDVTSKIATASLNGGVDFIINQVKLVARTTNMDVVSLPDIDVPLYPGASLKATGGYFKSITSISRGGDIVVSRDGLAFIIDFPVELQNMEIGFKNYEISVFMGMGTSGVLKVGVKQNRINIRLRLAISTSCAINLEKVDFAVLDGLDISMTYGCSMCGYITDKATSYIANFLQNTIRLQIQGQIDSILKKTLSENALICSKFMGQ